MKFLSGLITTALAGALLGTSIYASSYTIDSDSMPTPDSYSLYHWDIYNYIYKPGKGWVMPKANLTGNGSNTAGYFTVLADDGSTGQIVDVSIKIKGVITVSYENYWLSGDDQDWQAKVANFAGFDSGIVTFPLHCGSNVALLSDSFFGSTAIDLTLNTQAVVGKEDSLNFWLDHGIFCPSGLKVFDETKPAAFAVRIDSKPGVSGIEAHDVPENVSTLALLLGVSLLCLALLWLTPSRRYQAL